MQIRQDLISPDKYALKCPYPMSPQFIVVHNTANDAPADNEIKYMKRSNVSTSFHFAVDDKEIVQGIPENRNAFHAGDGNTGDGNRFGLAIEICYSKSGGKRFEKSEENAIKLIVYLLKKYNWDISKVKKHQDFSGKYCPHRTLDNGWYDFIERVKKELNGENIVVSDIVNYLADKGIITNVPLWTSKIANDTNVYWLARKCAEYIKGLENG